MTYSGNQGDDSDNVDDYVPSPSSATMDVDVDAEKESEADDIEIIEPPEEDDEAELGPC